MARTLITAQDIPAITSEGFNLTDATFTTMSTGSNNGVKFTHDPGTLIVMKNDTVGAADYTMILGSIGQITAVGGTVTDPVVDVAVGKTHIIRPDLAFKQSDGMVYIDCDVAAKILVLNVD